MTDWREWSLDSHGLTWRIALPEDEAALAAIQDATEARLGPQDRPYLFAAPVMIALVAVDESGAIVDAFYLEAECHIKKLGLNRRAMACGPDLVPVIADFIAHRGIRVARMTVMTRWGAVMDRVLWGMGFAKVDGRWANWVRRLR